MIKDYLTEANLYTFLYDNISTNIIHNKKFCNEINKRPDYVLPDNKLIIEHDGFNHYTNAKNAFLDSEFREFMNINYPEWTLINIPYFVQLDNIMCKYYFNMNISYNEFPHGFISKSMRYPADFCPLGLKRFIKEMQTFKQNVPSCYDAIIQSLDDVINKGNNSICIYGDSYDLI